MKKIPLRTLAEIGALTALICVLGPLSIPLPFSPAPIAFANLAIFFAVYLLGAKRGLLCTAVYLLLGFVGVPVFAVLLVLDLAVLAIGVACGAGGVGLIATAFIGLPMVADMLILLGGGAAVIAIALVVIWLAIWLFIRMVIGWVRLLVRLGKRWCRKEIAA